MTNRVSVYARIHLASLIIVPFLEVDKSINSKAAIYRSKKDQIEAKDNRELFSTNRQKKTIYGKKRYLITEASQFFNPIIFQKKLYRRKPPLFYM